MSAHEEPKSAAPAGAMFRPALRVGRFVHVSGTSATGDDGRAIAGDIEAQTRRALENLGARLAAAGSSLANAASIAVYLHSAADFAAMNEVYRSFWPQDPPARTTIVAGLADPGALVEMTAVGIETGAERRVVHPPGWVTSPNPYSYGVLSGDSLFLAGLVSRNGKDNSIVAGDIAAQTRTVLENGAALLKAAGMSHADVVCSRVFVTDAGLFPEMNAAYRAFFPKDPPARATVAAALMGPQYRVEITLLAARGARVVSAAREAQGASAGLPSSAAVRAGERLYLSGVVGGTEANRVDAFGQTRETLARIGRTLQAAGCGFSDVVDAVVYVSDMRQREAVERAWREVFPKDPPAGVIVETPLVAPHGLVEIMLVAAGR